MQAIITNIVVNKKSSWQSTVDSVPPKLNLSELGLFGAYSLATLVDLEIVQLPTSVDVSGQKNDDLESILLNPGIAERLKAKRVKIGRNYQADFGENFSNLVDYNSQLLEEIPAQGGRQHEIEKRAAIIRHFATIEDCGYPIYTPKNPTSLRELIKRAEAHRYYMNEKLFTNDIMQYIQAHIILGTEPEKVVPELKQLLKEIADKIKNRESYMKIREHQFNIALSKNAKLLFESYARAGDFLKKFHTQIKILAELYNYEPKAVNGHFFDSYSILEHRHKVHGDLKRA